MISSELIAEDAFATTEPPLFQAARIKLQSLLRLAEEQASEGNIEKYPSLPVIQDYNQLLALVRRAVPELKPAFPPDIMTSNPAEDKFTQLAKWSVWYHIFKLWKPSSKKNELEDLKLLTYREFLTFCRQIERLLK